MKTLKNPSGLELLKAVQASLSPAQASYEALQDEIQQNPNYLLDVYEQAPETYKNTAPAFVVYIKEQLYKAVGPTHADGHQ